jgi:hypothetical protein
MDTRQFIFVTVSNISAADFSRVIITFGTLGADTIDNLGADATVSFSINAQAKVLDSVVAVSVSYTPSASGAFDAGNSLIVGMSLSDLRASRVEALDSLFNGYLRIITNEYSITDTVDVDYLDVDKGLFVYSATNHTGANMELSVVHRNLWQAEFCRTRIPPLNSVNDLAGLTRADSLLDYYGDVTPGSVNFPAGTVNKFSKTNISGIRMFPEWNPVTKNSVTKVDYCMNVAVMNKRLTLSANDSFEFDIHTTSLKYKEMSGTVMETYKRSSDSLKFAIPASWIAGPSPENFFCDYFTAVNMPAGAVLDTLGVSQKIFSVKNADSSCQWSAIFAPAVRNTFISKQVDIARVIRLKPDTICIIASSNLPSGAHVVLENDLTNPTDSVYSKYIGRMIICDSLSFAPSAAVLHGHAAPQTFACEGMFPVLRYALREQCRVSAACYDLRGRLVYSYVNKSQGPGSYALPIPTSSWPRGAYCMVFKAGSFERMEKVVVVR